MDFLTGRQRSLKVIPKAAFIFRNSMAIILKLQTLVSWLALEPGSL
jgi:hypothetical protein